MRKRRWFQLHLVTWVVLSLAACGCLYLNVQDRERPSVGYFQSPGSMGCYYGWPFYFYRELLEPGGYRTMDWSLVVLDLLVALAILAVVAVITEWLARLAHGGEKESEGGGSDPGR
jgi:hypothetical protein